MESSNLLAAQPNSFQTYSDANHSLQASPCMKILKSKIEASIKVQVLCNGPKSIRMALDLLTFSHSRAA